ncbi:MAG: ABC transporter ATP-binding protein [Epsilonproteobacteria bacterium]|nr:ABC transporter ATP-binding protein [Campylobacterota bacterium]
MLEVKNITVKYGKKIGAKDISFSAKEGEIIGLIGADGAGKSSTLHAIAGVKGFDGEIVYNGYAYHSPKEAEKIKHHLSLMPQGLGLVLYDLLSVKEHFDFFRGIRGVKRDIEYEKRLLKMAGLYEFQDRLAGNLSGGMRQKLSLILSLLHRPKLLILDEPTTGVDPISRRELWEIVDNQRKQNGIIALISTAYMQEAELMDKILLFDEGEIIARGGADELIESIKDYTYKGEMECEGCMSFSGKTYSLKPLNAKKDTPTLEGLFFVNALKKGKKMPKITLEKRELNTPEVVVKAVGLTKRFGDFIADDHIDLELKKGEILGLLGANGAGKTTFMKMLLGLYPIDEGELYLLGEKISSYKDRIKLKSKIGYVSQRFALYDDLTIQENINYFGKMHNLTQSEIDKKKEFFADLLGFKEFLNAFPKDVPLGINQRFSVAVALLHDPVVLFLDEPTSGVDTIARASFWKFMRELKEKWGISILITTHYMSEAEYCDRVVILKRGKKILDDTLKDIHIKYPKMSFEDIFIKLVGSNDEV